MRVLLAGAALLLTRAGLIAESRRRGQQSDRREEHDKTLDSLHTFTSSQKHEVDDTSRTDPVHRPHCGNAGRRADVSAVLGALLLSAG